MTRHTIIFWIIAGLLLIWNAMGSMNYILQSNPDNVAQMPQLYQDIINARPAWATAGFATHVFAGTAGCLLLFARRSMASALFIISFIAGLIFFAFILLLFRNGTVDSSAFIGPLLSVLVALFSIWYARRQTNIS